MFELLTGGGDIAVTVAVFGAAAALVWWAGSRLAGYADRLASATGIGGAVVGLVLLGGVTSLPEIATSVTAGARGDAPLAVNNLIGGVSAQLLVLAVLDFVSGPEALTAKVPRPDVLGYAAMNVLLLALTAGAIASGDLDLFGSGVGLGSIVLIVAYAACVAAAREMDQGAGWRPIGLGALTAASDGVAEAKRNEKRKGKEGESVRRLGLLVAGAGAVILVGGYVLTRTGEALAEQTGLGSGFFGVAFLAAATSLPELSSALAAVRLKRPQMALGDVFGGNLFDIALIAVVDAVYLGGPVLAEVGAFSIAAAALGAVLGAVYMMGMVERRDRTVLRMGYDSLAVVLLYVGGLAVLFTLRAE